MTDPAPLPPSFFDAYTPDQIALRVEKVGIAKAGLSTLPLFALTVLAGAFIVFGAMFFTVAVTGSQLGFGPTRVLGGIAFSLGLILVVIGGAELFTGNALMVMDWAAGKVATPASLRTGASPTSATSPARRRWPGSPMSAGCSPSTAAGSSSPRPITLYT
jgi:hypothetical protein